MKLQSLKQKIKCKIDNASLFNHFRTLFSNENVFVNEETELFLNDDNRESVSILELDNDFVVEEVISANSCLKRGKSAGIDSLLPEIFIECKTFLSLLLCKLFSYIYTNSLYPASWSKGVIVPVPKKGDISDVNIYRGITLTSIFSKIFSILLDNRLRKWAENSNVLHVCQYGFRKQRSTVDCIFILSCIIDMAVKREKRKLYCSFVDFKKAFDLVYRNDIWQKLLNYGASTKIVKMLRATYEKVQPCVCTEGNLSDSFERYSGVKQVEPLFLLLFILFINDTSVRFLKRVLSLNRNVTSAWLYGELGRFPLSILRKIRIIKYWFKICTQTGSFMHKFSCDYYVADLNHSNSWFANVKHLLSDLGFMYLWNNPDVNTGHKSTIIQRVYDQYVQQCFSKIGFSSKLCLYYSYKDSFVLEDYLTHVNNDKYRQALCKLRCSDHKLSIEIGRHNNIPRDGRLCQFCNMNVVEDEYHFLLVCPKYSILRNEIFPRYCCRWPTKHKFVQLMGSPPAVLLNKVAKLVYLAFELRST